MRSGPRGAAYSALGIVSCGAQLDEQSKELAAISDYALAYELGLRGYDVKLTTPTDTVIERRIKKRDAAKAEKAEPS